MYLYIHTSINIKQFKTWFILDIGQLSTPRHMNFICVQYYDILRCLNPIIYKM